MDVQIDSKHYFSQKYNHKARWLSFWYQINLVAETGGQSILEIGPGNGTTRDFLKKGGKDVKTLDIDASVGPDFVGSVDKMLLHDGAFDCVLAAEILEHLPFEKFVPSLKEIFRVSKKYAVVSLPDARRTILNFSLKIPFLPTFGIFLQIPSFKKHDFNGQHYWEPGKAGYSLKKINSAILESGWKIKKSFTPPDVPTKHFYLLTK